LIAHKVFEKKLLRVIFENGEEKAYKVITAYYTKPKRYIKNENSYYEFFPLHIVKNKNL